MPHSGLDEVDYIEALEAVRACFADDEHRGSDSIEWYEMYGLACDGTADDIIAYEKKQRWFQFLKECQLHRDQHLDEE